MNIKNIDPEIWIVSLIAVLSLGGCEKVIDLDLGTVTPQVVIEGSISNAQIRHTVKVSKTTGYYETGAFRPLSDVTVMIADDSGYSELLEETSDGIYQTSEFSGVEGRSYTLTVLAEGKEYTATSTMPEMISIDTIFMTETTRWGETARSVRAQFKDTRDATNYYRFYLVRDDDPFTAKFILDDRLYNGELINYDLVQLSKDPFESGNIVRVDLYCIDADVYNYFATLPSNWEPPAVPANPVSNISNNALGYFSAQTVSTKWLTVE